MDLSSLAKVNALSELERIGWTWETIGGDEVKLRCPAHGDQTPSASMNVKSNVWKCHSGTCQASGDLVTFLCYALKTTRKVVTEELATRYELDGAKTVDPTVVEGYHQKIWEAHGLLLELRKRGISDRAIRTRRLGENAGRITIPIYNEHGSIVNVRRYLPGAVGSDKVKNTRGFGGVRLYPIDQLRFSDIVITGGEIKADLLADLLNEHGFGAIATTGGEGSWEPEFSPKFEGKRVWSVMDIDDAGRRASQKICARVKPFAKFVADVVLPLDKIRHPHGDVNDYFGVEKRPVEEFIALLREAQPWKPVDSFEPEDEPAPIAVKLNETSRADLAAKKVSVCGVVTALDTQPYLVPENVVCVCEKDQENCDHCPVFASSTARDKYVTLTVSKSSPHMLSMIASPKAAQREATREALKIPPCKTVVFHPKTFYNVEDARLVPKLELSSGSTDQVVVPVYAIGKGLEANETYDLVGRTFPHPKTQQAVFLASQFETSQDAMSTFAPDETDLAALELFQPSEWSEAGLRIKLRDLYADLTANVTRIFMRDDLHLMVDLGYFSPLVIKIDGRPTKGWTEVLVVGDSAQGKTETVVRMMEHYKLGEKVECKNATVAGLLGGLQSIGGRWFVSWGVIPKHDRRLVFLEELKGASTDVIAKLTDMRSSGQAEIPKIERRRTHARTRLIAVTNPRSDRPIRSYTFGVEAVKEVIGAPEDVRRFDAIMVVSSDQIDVEKLSQMQRSKSDVPHRHTSELCHRQVLWAWTRTPDQIQFVEEAYEACLVETARLCSKFTDRVPIVDRGSMRIKLSRLSAALAARTFSCAAKDYQKLVVRECHVRYVADFLDRTYSDRCFGYSDFSEAVMAADTLVDPAGIRKKIFLTPFPRQFIEQLLHTQRIEVRDVCDWLGWNRDDGIDLLAFLVRKHALVRDGHDYRKSSAFITLLKEALSSEDLKIVDRPDFIKDGKENF